MNLVKEKVLNNNILNYLITLIAAAFVAYLALVLVYLIPSPVILKNLDKDMDLIQSHDSYQQLVPGYKSTQLDNFTDDVMMSLASYDGEESILKKAAASYHYDDFPKAKSGKKSYGWYWHGYLVVLKPLLAIMSYTDIIMFNCFAVIVAIALTIYYMINRAKNGFLLPYLLAVIIINPITVAMSFQYSTIWYTMHICLLYMIIKGDGEVIRNLAFILFIQGILVAFFDLLTYPLPAYGIPVALGIYVMRQQEKDVLFVVKKIVTSGIAFVLGYGGMFATKILISFAAAGQGALDGAMEHLTMRLSGEGLDQDISRIDAVMRNLQVLDHLPYRILFFVILAIAIFGVVRDIRNDGPKAVLGYVPCMLLALLPILWYFVLANHSHIHYFFTFRNLSVSFAALGMMTLFNAPQQQQCK